MRIQNITLVTENRLIFGGAIHVKDGKILAVYERPPEQWKDMQTVDGKGCYAVPGFVDIHVHGGGGVEFMNASAQQIRIGCIAHAKHGTTTLLPTSMTAPADTIYSMISQVQQAQKITTECTIAGVHLEGPFLSAAQSGAQNSDSLLIPEPQAWEPLLSAWPGGIRIVGAAPELPGAMLLGEALKKQGIVGSIAHSDAGYSVCCEALAHGFTDITHIYSGCSMVHRKNGYRYGGVVEAGLVEDGFTVQVIADGKHLPPELLKLIYKCKGPKKISLITDALFAAAGDAPEGVVLEQASGVQTVLEDGVMKLLDRQAFAGSIATMDKLVRNMVQLAGVPLYDAVTMASETPANIIGMGHCKGALKPGYDADIVLLNQDLFVEKVFARGREVAV